MSGAEVKSPIVRDLMILNQRGLHARASAKFVQLAGAYDAVIEVAKDGTTVGGTSIMGLMMLAAGQGVEVEVETNGQNEEAAMQALLALIDDKFGEGE